MSKGIRATVEFAEPACPAVEATRGSGGPVRDARTSVAGPDGEPAVTDVAVASPPAGGDRAAVFERGDEGWFRVAHDGAPACPCEHLGALGIPVARYTLRDGRLTLVFHAADFEELRTAIAALREAFPGMDVRRFIRTPGDGATRDDVVVDRGRLTARQLEVLETALDLGYFERPRGANATEVAAALDIDPSTFSEHLAAAERKLVGEVLERGP